MTRHRAVLDLGRTVADEDHVLDPGLPLLSAAVRLAERTAGAQTLRQLTPQGAAALDVDRLIDRLVRHPHLRLRSEEHTSELQSRQYLVCRLLLEKKNKYSF